MDTRIRKAVIIVTYTEETRRKIETKIFLHCNILFYIVISTWKEQFW